MDVKTAFLNGILLEEVYVGQPPGFVSKQYLNHVYALDKALYGLKQAPRAWYNVLSQFLIESGFQKGSIDITLFIKRNVPTPMVEQAKLKLDLVGKLVDHTDYRSMIGSQDKMSRDVITVGSTMRIPLLYRGEHSQWRERFMNYLEEQTDGEAMINSIQNGDQPFPVIAQVSLAGNTHNAPPTLKDPKFWTAEEKKTRKINRLARSLLIPNDIYSLIDSNETAKDLWDSLESCELNYKFLNNLQPEWKQYGDVNDDLGYKKKAVVVTLDPLALVDEKSKVSKRKEKVEVQSESEGSDDEDISDLKKITALLAKAFNRKKYYAKPTNNNLRTSLASSAANKKPEYVKSVEKKEDKKADEKKRDMSKVKCYNCKKEGHFAKDYKKAKEINANMVFMAQIEKVLLDSDESSSSAEETIAEKRIEKANQQSKDESSSSSLNDDVQQSPEEVILPQTNTQSILNNMIPNVNEASTSHNVFNEHLKDAYFDAIGRIEAIRLFLAYAAHKDFTVFQIDVKTTFLNGILKEEVYVGQPPGFVSKIYPDHVYALDKALYGLKQAPQACEYDTVIVEINVPHHDHLREMKMDLRDGHSIQARMGIKKSHSCRNYFIVENVKSSCVKGPGISIPLRAFSRVQLDMEATEDDGHLARIPLKNKAREMEAHGFLHLKFDGMIENHNAALQPLTLAASPTLSGKCA
nr:reverse transcriptase [Tanacetum cinerariifolium]